MRAIRWGMGVLLLVVTAAVVLWPGEERAPLVEPETPVAALPVAEPSAPVPRAAPLPEPDAVVLTPEPAHEVQFTLVRDGGALVGERITLSRNRERVGGTINVMGFVTLPLTPGEWTVENQWGTPTEPNKVLITPDSGLVTLTVVPRENLTVCVTTESNTPLRADVHVRGGSRTDSSFTGADGCRSMAIKGDEADVWVGNNDFRSAVQHVQLPAKVQLRAAKLHQMWIELKPESVVSGVASVSHRLGVSTGDCTPQCRLQIPSGEYELLVAGVNNGQLLFARQSGTARSKDMELVVTLGPAPPITGVVRNAAGVPLPNVPLRFVTLRFVTLDASSADIPGSKPALEMARVLTRDDGSFSVQPNISTAGPFPAWKIFAEPPWKLSPAAVALGDKPLELTAELITP